MNGAGLDLGTVTILVAFGAGLTFLALCVVFGGFFAERRLRDRLEDIETRALTGSRSLQMATLRRVERQGRLPTLDRLLWRWFPNASTIRQKLRGVGHQHDAGRLRLRRHLDRRRRGVRALPGARPGAGHGAGRLAAARHRPAQRVGRLARQEARPTVQPPVPRGGRPDRARAARRPAGAGGDRQRGARHQGPGRRHLPARPAGDAARHADRGRAVARRQDRADRRVQLPDRRHVDPARHRRQSRRDAGQPERAAARPPAAAPEDPRLHLRGAHHHADHGRPAVPGRRRPVPDIARATSGRCSRRRPAR